MRKLLTRPFLFSLILFIHPSTTPLTDLTDLTDRTVPTVQQEGIPPVPPTGWIPLIGEYGRDTVTRVMVLERGGVLVAHYPGGRDDTLRARSENTFASSRGPIRFSVRDSRAITLTLGDSTWPRRPLGDAGSVFRINPVRPVPELRREALAASPPSETGEFRATDLVELTRLDSTIKLDIRYASTRNFLGTPVYTQARAFLQRPAAEAVARINRRLRAMGLGLLIHDGYRPWYVTRIFWDATPPAQHEFVADPREGSRHNRGCAVDLSLYDLKTGKPIDMPGVYDEFSHRSYPDYPGGTTRQRWYRDLLRRVMEADGFAVFPSEWWHFDFKDWKSYRIQNVRFEEIKK